MKIETFTTNDYKAFHQSEPKRPSTFKSFLAKFRPVLKALSIQLDVNPSDLIKNVIQITRRIKAGITVPAKIK